VSESTDWPITSRVDGSSSSITSLFTQTVRVVRTKELGNIRSKLFELFEGGMGQDMPGVRSTSWAALNAVTEYVDHHRSTRGHTDFDRRSRRLESAWFGSGSRLKSKAWTLALEMAG
jgi:hypothetical protein